MTQVKEKQFDGYEVFVDEEERPATKSNVVMCRVFEVKFGEKEGENMREEIQELHDNRKEWQSKLDKWIASKLRYKERKDIPLTIKEMTDDKALSLIKDKVVDKLGLKLGNPPQKSLEED